MLRIGPAGWAYKDWNGIVYPAGLKNAERLDYLARYFDVIEINTSFYSPISAATAKRWCEEVASNPHFRFTAKMWKAITHEHVAGKDADEAIHESFAPLLDASRLGALLLQFLLRFTIRQKT